MRKLFTFILSILLLTQMISADCTTTGDCKGNPDAPSLVIIKKDAHTKAPLSGAIFTVYDTTGNVVCEYTTDTSGKIVVKSLKAGWYKVVETKAPDGYTWDDTAKDVEISKGITQKVIFENKKLSGLTIKKIDEHSRTPIPNTGFRLYKDGIVIGNYITNFDGIINMPKIMQGNYELEETKPAHGYIAQKGKTSFSIKQNETKEIVITNTKASGVIIYKIDKLTGKPLQGVQFMIFDQNHRPIGEYTTDDNGRILIDDRELTAGRYKLKETKTKDGYILDSNEKSFTLETGKLTTITIENTPKSGFIQVLKRAGADNIADDKMAGEPLQGAIFALFDQITGEEITQFTSGYNGWAISPAVPVGTYILKEIQAPFGYKLADDELKVTLKDDQEVLRYEILNYPSNLRVDVNKFGPSNALTGSILTYHFDNIRNMSATHLDQFYLRDSLPSVLTPISLETGTFNVLKTYNVSVVTNQRKEFIVANGLSTSKNNVIDLSASALNLKDKEKVTHIKFNFDTVPSGFINTTTPKLKASLQKGLPNGFYFVNKADVGGFNGHWVIKNVTSSGTSPSGSSTPTGTIVVNPNVPKIPKTGF